MTLLFFEVATLQDGVNANWMAVSPSGVVYVTNAADNAIRKIEGGVVTDLISSTDGNTDGPLSTALFRGPSGIVSDQAGNLYIADQANHRIRKIDTSGNVTTVAGPSGPEKLHGWVDDLNEESLFTRPKAIAIDATDRTLYVSEGNRIRSIPLGFVPGRTLMAVSTVAAVGFKGFADGPPTVAQFNDPLGLAVTQMGDLIVADTHNHRIRRVTPSGMVTTLAGEGVPAVPTDAAQFADVPAMHARFERPLGVAVDQAGTVWVADGTHVRMYFPTTNIVSTALSDHLEPIKFEHAFGIAISQGKIFVTSGSKIMVLTPHEGHP
jgi:DNA-binding beta-propeller fold protein YncE